MKASWLFGVDFVDLFSSFVFPDYINPFNICCKAGLVVLNSLNICFLKSLLFLHQFWMRSLPGTVILGVDFSLSVLKIYPVIPFWPAEFLLKDQLVKCMGFPLYVTCCFSLVAFNILSLSLVFVSLISMCLGIFLLGFILYRTLCASWTWLTISFSIFGKFSTIISSKIFSYPFFFSSSSGTPIIQILVLLMLS